MTDAQANARCKELALKMTPVHCRLLHGENLDFISGMEWAYQFLRAAMRDTPARPILAAAAQAATPAPRTLFIDYAATVRPPREFVVYRDPNGPYTLEDAIVWSATSPKQGTGVKTFTILKSRTISPHHRRTRIR